MNKCSQCGVCCKIFVVPLNENEYKSGKYKTQFEEFGVVDDFREAEDFDWSTAYEALDDRKKYSEERWIALGYICNRLHVMIYTTRGRIIRIISLRKANKREREYYETQAK